jgi:hypothetical protein
MWVSISNIVCCVTALTKIVDHILKEMDQWNYTGVLFLDYKKACWLAIRK